MAQPTVDATRRARLIESLRRRAEHPRTPTAEAALARRKLDNLLAETPSPTPPRCVKVPPPAPKPPRPKQAPKRSPKRRKTCTQSLICHWVRDPHDPSSWAVQGPVGVVVTGADVTVERRDGEQSIQTITGLGPITRWGQIGYIR